MFIQKVLALSLLLAAPTAAVDVPPACSFVDFLPLVSKFTTKEQELALVAFTKGTVPQNSCFPATTNSTVPTCDATDCVKLLGSVNKMLANLDLIPSCTEPQSAVVLDKVIIGEQLTASQKALIALCPNLPELLVAASPTTASTTAAPSTRPFSPNTNEGATPTAASLASLALLVFTLTALL